MKLTPLGPAIGALVEGLDPTRPLEPHDHAALNTALLAHHVLFFENQPVTPRQQRDFAARFGPLHVHFRRRCAGCSTRCMRSMTSCSPSPRGASPAHRPSVNAGRRRASGTRR